MTVTGVFSWPVHIDVMMALPVLPPRVSFVGVKYLYPETMGLLFPFIFP